jgi:hypothetical protein
MPLVASYEFTLKGGEVIRGATLYSKTERQEKQPHFPGSNIRCDLERVEVIHTSDARFRPRIFWSDQIFGKDGNAQLLKELRNEGPLDIALVEVQKDCQPWIVRSEPTLDDRIGITVSSSKGQVLFTGIGDLTPVEFTPRKPELKPRQGHILTFVFREVYSWRMYNPMDCGHTTGSVRKESPNAYPDYSASHTDGGYD